MLKRVVIGLGVLVVLVSVFLGAMFLNADFRNWVLFAPNISFRADNVPTAPDYATEAAWAALPSMSDGADQVPPDVGAADNQAQATADVFYIHPTTYFSKDGWNAPIAMQGEALERLESGVLRFQASAFNGCCRVFAPRYRQATLYAFMSDGPSTLEAYELAYEDVLAAFRQFLAERNQGRPFILAGHSQGSMHGMRLLQEEIAGTPVQLRLIAAYLVGFSTPADMGVDMAPCAGPEDIRCIANWNSVTQDADIDGWTQTGLIWLDGKYQPIAGRKLNCVNPLTGAAGTSAPAAANKGALPFVPADIPLRTPLPAFTGADCKDVLIVDPPADTRGFRSGVFAGDYHIYDYNLFYMNLRETFAAKVAAFGNTGWVSGVVAPPIEAPAAGAPPEAPSP